LLLIGLLTACGPRPFELTSHVTVGGGGRLAFWWKCLSLKCSIDEGAPVNYSEVAGRPFEFVVEDSRQNGAVIPALTFVSSDDSKLAIVSSTCNPSCARDLTRSCHDGALDCGSGVDSYLVRLNLLTVGDVLIEAHSEDGTLYDEVPFAVTPAPIE